MRYKLTDDEWTAIKPLLPNKPRGVPRVNDRRVLNGIFWVLRSGAPWRDLPENFGPYTTCYNRFVRWRRAGDFPDNCVTLTALIEVEPGTNVARHTRPGVETAYILEGELELFVQGQPGKKVKAGDSYQVLREVRHSARNGDRPTRAVITYVVDKGKPLASPAPG